MMFATRRSFPLLAAPFLAAALAPGAARADTAELADRITGFVAHADTAGDFIYTLSPSFDGCTLTLVETETEAAKPEVALRETTITIDLGKLDPSGVAVTSAGGTFVTVTMQAGANIGYVDSYAYGRVDRLDEPSKTLDIAASAEIAEPLVLALAELARECQSGGTVVAGGTTDGGSTTRSGSSGWGFGDSTTAGGGTTTAGGGTTTAGGGTTWGGGGGTTAGGGSDEPAAWETARAADTIEAYQGYLDAHPDGEHVFEALQRIAAITAAGSGGGVAAVPTPAPLPAGDLSAELDAWQAARRSNRPEDYRAYLATWPNGEFAILAQNLIDGTAGLDSSGGSGGSGGGGGTPTGSDDDMWRTAIFSDDPADYLAYLRAYPSGIRADAARTRLEQLGVDPDSAGGGSGGGSGGGGGGGTPTGSDDEMWRAAIFSDDPADYQAYLRAYPDGTRAEAARRRLEQLGVSPDAGGGSGGGFGGAGGGTSGGTAGGTAGGGVPAGTEPELWRRAIFSDAPEDYQAYIRAYPDGPNAETARNRLRAFGIDPQSLHLPDTTRGVTFGESGDAVEDGIWAEIVLADEAPRYEWYLAAYPDGRYAAEARTALDRLGVALPETGPAAGATGITPGVEAILDGSLASAEAAEDALGLRRSDRREIQRRLRLIGYDPGPADGAIGPRSRSAIRDWQSSRGYPATGYLDAAQKAALYADSESAYTAWLAEERRRTPEPTRTTGREGGGTRPAVAGSRPSAGGAIRADGCARRSNGSVIGGQSARCDAIGAAEALGGILGN